MSTKGKPGEFDCLKKMGDDEPFFVLRAKDPVAAYLVSIWRHVRAGDQRSAEDALLAAEITMQEHVAIGVKDLLPRDSFKSREAAQVASDMHEWRADQWRTKKS